MLQAATDGKEPGRTTRASIRKQTGPVKKDEKGKESGIALGKSGRGASEKATVKGTVLGKSGGRGRGRGGKAGARGRDAGEELEKEPEPEPETEALAPEAEDHSDSVVVRFTSGSAFDMNSIVSIIPATPIKDTENNEFHAKVIKYSAERKILKLQYEGTDKKRYLIYSNRVLKVGTEIVGVDNPKVRAKVDELDAEWHRHQPWAHKNEHVGETVVWDVENDGCDVKHEGTVWGWLPANESEYYPNVPEDKGGVPLPLWRVKFSMDINDADLDENELAKALEKFRTKDAHAAEKGKKKNKSRESEVGGSEEWTPGTEQGTKRKKTEASDEIDDDVPIGKRNKSKETKPSRELDDDAPILKKKRPSESSGSLIKSSETNGDALKHDKNRSDDVPAVKRPKEDGIEIKEEKSKIRKDSLGSNGSSAVN
eukprot:CAMPEP_0179424606 /NCGR_PEP_ID=MMETSP0799-20121207/11688_1 /TAXON_ID=46947 /ORGANISM="Geminigera cryophila, Strain CCMP2564" /LENGTH=425 /DNA_ID=CAMNT_0021199089 /DNA_START=171 /DNA_END=1445 /DNA_ORIENTATION=+